jgi:N-acetylmuramoyl-L-alanine amidase
MIHSTGANNPNLRRYVHNDPQGRIGTNSNGNHWNQPMPGGRSVCVHAFIGRLAEHAGSGSKGSANSTHIGFEICEDGLTDAKYFAAVYQESAELCAMLCKEFKLDPLASGVIIGHYEGYKLGIASNHADPAHWFSRHGKTMDDFRKLVKQLLDGSAASTPATKPEPLPVSTPAPAPNQKLFRVQVGAYTSKTNAEAALARAKSLGFKDAFIFR